MPRRMTAALRTTLTERAKDQKYGADRLRIVSCYAEDEAVVGDLFYGEMSEDGDVPVLRPEHAVRITCETANGRRFTFDGAARFGTDFLRGAWFARRVEMAGTIDLAHWTEGRCVYGSSAFEAIMVEEFEAEKARDLGW